MINKFKFPTAVINAGKKMTLHTIDVFLLTFFVSVLFYLACSSIQFGSKVPEFLSH